MCKYMRGDQRIKSFQKNFGNFLEKFKNSKNLFFLLWCMQSKADNFLFCGQIFSKSCEIILLVNTYITCKLTLTLPKIIDKVWAKVLNQQKNTMCLLLISRNMPKFQDAQLLISRKLPEFHVSQLLISRKLPEFHVVQLLISRKLPEFHGVQLLIRNSNFQGVYS